MLPKNAVKGRVEAVVAAACKGHNFHIAAGSRGYLVCKRIIDVIVSVMLLAIFAHVMLVAAAIIKLTSHGPVLFRQTRSGLNGEQFTIYKFRTMYEGAEDDREYLEHLNEKTGPIFKMAEDPRLAGIGRFLRRSSIDELPQLFNVLSGKMSMVGPRPMWYPEALKEVGAARLRKQVKPGLTCLWQISGRSELSYDEWVRLDLYYIRHRSLLLDFLILVQTIPAVLSGRGAY